MLASNSTDHLTSQSGAVILSGIIVKAGLCMDLDWTVTWTSFLD